MVRVTARMRMRVRVRLMARTVGKVECECERHLNTLTQENTHKFINT